MALYFWRLVLLLHNPTLLGHGHTLLLGVVIDLHLVTHLDVLILALFKLALGVAVQLVIGFVFEVDTAIFGHFVFLDDDGTVWLALDFHAAVGSGVDDAGLFCELIGAVLLFVGDLVGFGLFGRELGGSGGFGIPVVIVLAWV